MQNRKRNILCTKELDADLLHLAAEAGIYIHCIPFIETAALPEAILKTQLAPFSGMPVWVVFTSANAVSSVARLDIDGSQWHVYCINGLTQKTVKHAFPRAIIEAVAANGKSLAEKILNQHSGHDNVLFCCGDRRRNEVPETLTAAGIPIKEVVVYNTVLKPVVVSDNYDAYVFFSPSGVESFLKCNNLPKDATIFTIGETTAACLKDITKNVIISEEPDTAFLIKKMISHFTIDTAI
jgi:uroporphyrinogen-III synthase